MKNDIKEKLRAELSLDDDVLDEPKVVYILSRVRKILEIDRKEKQYKILKFYCDWALHAEIENIDAVRSSIDGVVAGDGEAQVNFILFHSDFHIEFKKFLTEYNLPISICEDKPRTRLNSLLSQIYSDTPLIIKTVKRKRITWQAIPPGKTPSFFGGSFKFEDVE